MGGVTLAVRELHIAASLADEFVTDRAFTEAPRTRRAAERTHAIER